MEPERYERKPKPWKKVVRKKNVRIERANLGRRSEAIQPVRF